MSTTEKMLTALVAINSVQRMAMLLAMFLLSIVLLSAASDPIYFFLQPLFRWNILEEKEKNIRKAIVRIFIGTIIIYMLGSDLFVRLILRIKLFISTFI